MIACDSSDYEKMVSNYNKSAGQGKINVKLLSVYFTCGAGGYRQTIFVTVNGIGPFGGGSRESSSNPLKILLS